MLQLTDKGKERMMGIQVGITAVGLLGGIGGVIYSNKKGGGFWRGVGYFLLGNFVLSVPVYLATLPARNKIIAEEGVDNNIQTKQYYSEVY